MVNPEKGTPLQARARALVDKYGKQPQAKPRRKSPEGKPEAVEPAGESAQTDAPVKKKPWWKLW